MKEKEKHSGMQGGTGETGGGSTDEQVVELRDIALERQIYSPRILRNAIVGALIGAVLLGTAAWLVASGIWEIDHLGQFNASGEGWATFTGAGAGAALGAMWGIRNQELRIEN